MKAPPIHIATGWKLIFNFFCFTHEEIKGEELRGEKRRPNVLLTFGLKTLLRAK